MHSRTKYITVIKTSFIALFLVATTLFSFGLSTSSTHAVGEYDCGTYGAGEFGESCTDDTPTTSNTNNASNPNATSDNTPTSTVDPITTPTDPAGDGNTQTDPIKEVIDTATGKTQFSLWFWLISLFIIIAGIVTARLIAGASKKKQ